MPGLAPTAEAKCQTPFRRSSGAPRHPRRATDALLPSHFNARGSGFAYRSGRSLVSASIFTSSSGPIASAV